MKRWGTILVALCSAGVLLACGDSEVAQSQQPRQAAVKPPAPTDVPTDGPSSAEFKYDATDRRDPFRSFVQGLYGADEGVASPLERFDLSQLTLMAIVWGTEAPKALIRDPAGKGYVVSEGAIVGKNKGRIVTIGDNLVLVKETYVDHLDRATTKAVEMRLRETQDSKESQGG
jgi:type IV pilus assembly protein PilP